MPAGTDVAAVTPVMVELLARYDAAVTAILADPRVASDLAHELVAAYLELFVPESEFAQGALAFWASEGEAGRFYRPGTSGVMLATVVESVTPVSADEVSVLVCSEHSYQIVDGAGSVIEAAGGRGPGTVTAVRVDGVWLLQDLSEAPSEECSVPETTG